MFVNTWCQKIKILEIQEHLCLEREVMGVNVYCPTNPLWGWVVTEGGTYELKLSVDHRRRRSVKSRINIEGDVEQVEAGQQVRQSWQSLMRLNSQNAIVCKKWAEEMKFYYEGLHKTLSNGIDTAKSLLSEQTLILEVRGCESDEGRKAQYNILILAKIIREAVQKLKAMRTVYLQKIEELERNSLRAQEKLVQWQEHDQEYEAKYGELAPCSPTVRGVERRLSCLSFSSVGRSMSLESIGSPALLDTKPRFPAGRLSLDGLQNGIKKVIEDSQEEGQESLDAPSPHLM